MIIGVGIDIIEVERVRKKLEDEVLVKKIFSNREVQLCRDRGLPEQHFAARFAAKEAFLKALGTGLNIDIPLYHIEVLNDVEGRPILGDNENINRLLSSHGIEHVHISLTHIKETSAAVVILEK